MLLTFSIVHVDELEELFSSSLLQLWWTGADTLRADVTMEGYNVRQLMNIACIHLTTKEYEQDIV